jgi:thiosulfate/3-mercaptopyruvate sulfurtransferase
MNPIITCPEVVGHEGPLLLIDVRHSLSDPTAGIMAYAKGHLPGAAFLSLDEELSGDPTPGNGGRHPLPQPEAFAQRLAELGATEDTLLVAYDDQGGLFASRFWWLARWIGHLKVAVLDGGLKAWVDSGGPLKADEFKASKAGKMSVRPSLCPRWNLEMVEAWVAAASNPDIAVLVDARAAERFRGEVEPIDPVAGHIPGAINRPYSHNLDDQGRFKPPSALRDELTAMLGEADPTSVVHSCGSGISACHNLLAMEAAGLVGSALYPGSWSEWCGRASPAARG